MYQRYSSGRGCIWRRPLVAVVGVLPSLQVAVSGRSVLLPRDSAAIRMCACASNGLYSPGPLHAQGKIGPFLPTQMALRQIASQGGPLVSARRASLWLLL